MKLWLKESLDVAFVIQLLKYYQKLYEGYPFGGPNCCYNKQSEFYNKSVDDMPDEFDCEVYQKEDWSY